MKFPGFDLNAISQMINSMSEEEKEQISSMAGSVMENMARQKAEEMQEEESVDFTEYLHLPEALCETMPAAALAALESGADLEQYYEEIEDADFSASALFYAKALLLVLRERCTPELFVHPISNPAYADLMEYAGALGESEELFADKTGFSSAQFAALQQGILQAVMFLKRAEYDVIDRRSLEVMKQMLLDQGVLDLAMRIGVRKPESGSIIEEEAEA